MTRRDQIWGVAINNACIGRIFSSTLDEAPSAKRQQANKHKNAGGAERRDADENRRGDARGDAAASHVETRSKGLPVHTHPSPGAVANNSVGR